MTEPEALAYEKDPNYRAFLATESPPWRAAWSATRPDTVTPRPLSPSEQGSMIEDHLEIIDKEIQHLTTEGVRLDIEEAVQDGAEGLCDAAQRYDAVHGVKFGTYAQHRVKGAIIDGIRSYDKLAGENRTQARVVSQLNNTRARSIFEPIRELGHGDMLNLADTIPADQPTTEEFVENREEVTALYEMIDLLDARQREIIMQRLQNLSRETIAQGLGVSLSTVDRELRKARNTLKTLLQPLLFETK